MTVDHVEPDGRVRGRHRRRDRVYAAAVELFIEQGFDATSMEQIAARAGVVRATVFNHFPRKAAFLDEWTAHRRARAARGFAEHGQDARSLRAIVHSYLAEFADLSEETRGETVAMMPAMVRLTGVHLDHPLGEDLARLIAATPDTLRPSADHALIGRLVTLGYFSTVARWAAGDPPPFDLSTELAAVVDVVLDGALA